MHPRKRTRPDRRRVERHHLVGRAAADHDDDRGWALTEAVAESWFKLLTYKDEYEVARLHGRYTVTCHLHPPILRRLGMAGKLPLRKPYELAFRALRPMKRLRGTPLDVRLAASAQSVKGYGPIKEAAVTAWRSRTAELRHPSAP